MNIYQNLSFSQKTLVQLPLKNRSEHRNLLISHYAMLSLFPPSQRVTELLSFPIAGSLFMNKSLPPWENLPTRTGLIYWHPEVSNQCNILSASQQQQLSGFLQTLPIPTEIPHRQPPTYVNTFLARRLYRLPVETSGNAKKEKSVKTH